MLAFSAAWVVHSMASVISYSATFALQPNFTEANDGPVDPWKSSFQIQ